MKHAAIALVLLMLLAGCADTTGQEAPSVEAVADDTLGTVEGTAVDERGYPLVGAKVTIYSVPESNYTDDAGHFVIPRVEPGTQTIRIEYEQLRTWIREIQVDAGASTLVEAILAPPQNLDPNSRPHVHDYWGSQSEITIFEGPARVETHPTDPGQWCGIFAYDEACYNAYIRLDQDQIIPPGTASVEIDVDFTPAYGPAEGQANNRRLYVFAPPTEADPNPSKRWNDLTPGTYEIPLGDGFVADHGHARWSDWRFHIYELAIGASYADPQREVTATAYDVTIRAIRGEVPIEAPHPRFWDDADRIDLVPSGQPSVCENTHHVTCYERTPDVDFDEDDSGNAECFHYCYIFQGGSIVPPGTTHLELRFGYYVDGTSDDLAAAALEDGFILGYKSPDKPRRGATWDDYVWPAEVARDDHPDGPGHVVTYSIPVGALETDPWYQMRSGWVLQYARPGEEDATRVTWDCPETCGRLIFDELEVVAVNDDAASD